MRSGKTVLFAIGIYWVTSVTVVQDAIAASGTRLLATELSITRLQYDGGGDWYANPSSLPNLLANIVERTSLSISQELKVVKLADPTLGDHPYLYMTGHGNVSFSDEEREALRNHLVSGGFLHADDNYGMDESFRREMELVFPENDLVEIPKEHPVFHTMYEFPDGLPKVHEHDGNAPQAYGIFHEDRLLVFYSFESDLGDGWENAEVHDDAPEIRELAIQMGVNLYLYVLGQLIS
jgi:hypothetical protein